MPNEISIPVIDISEALRVQLGFGKQPELEAVAQAIDDACCEVGFFAITGHGINQKIIDDAWNAAAAFFDLSLEEKLCVPAPTPQHAYGYSPMTAETLARSLGDDSLPDLKESLSIGPMELPPEIPLEAKGLLVETDWPAKPAELHPAWERYFAEMSELSARLLSIMAVALKLEPTYFEPMLRYHSSALRAVNYPHLAKLPREPAPPTEPPSNRRQSLVFFHNAAWDAEVKCIPTCLKPGEKPKYEPVLAGPHLLSKFASTVGDY